MYRFITSVFKKDSTTFEKNITYTIDTQWHNFIKNNNFCNYNIIIGRYISLTRFGIYIKRYNNKFIKNLRSFNDHILFYFGDNINDDNYIRHNKFNDDIEDILFLKVRKINNKFIGIKIIRFNKGK